MTTRQLVCEGACNPERIALDEEIRRFRKSGYGAIRDGVLTGLPDYLCESLRALQHTDHEIVNCETARCTVCGQVRRHGRPTRGFLMVA